MRGDFAARRFRPAHLPQERLPIQLGLRFSNRAVWTERKGFRIPSWCGAFQGRTTVDIQLGLRKTVGIALRAIRANGENNGECFLGGGR